VGNQPKYLSYKAAWERISGAMEAGYYLEVVAICESIISDRLLSYIEGVQGRQVPLKTSFGKLIQRWRKQSGAIKSSRGQDLIAAVDKWRDDRNTVVHGLVKSAPGRPTEDVDSFIEFARITAEEGCALARAVSSWHKKQKRASK